MNALPSQSASSSIGDALADIYLLVLSSMPELVSHREAPLYAGTAPVQVSLPGFGWSNDEIPRSG